MERGKKVCLACSAGGHLTELIQLERAWQGTPHFFVSDRRNNAIALSKRERVYFVACPRRNPLKLLVNILQSLWIFLKERPSAVVSTGADTAIPTCFIAKLFGSKVAFIESFCRVASPSLSGKMMYGKADLFLVQWKQNLEFFPKAKYRGGVF
ncbi:MAG: polysaccharide biosynthesis protein [Candidatus Diapherotrites archaeon]|uniref:Polysaccharide biosynthesis protein n=1 Tax=Candidatus Iainarchaeum sp. TaxID=3101447 RepID=A0A938YTX5_9ARCH|nr:polysaccharide biosynthesis protein [Candidatus Diapherotrites archaeon]